MLICPGSSVNRDEFLTQARPAAITLTLTNADGELTTREVRLRDEPGEQTFDVRGSEITHVRLSHPHPDHPMNRSRIHGKTGRMTWIRDLAVVR